MNALTSIQRPALPTQDDSVPTLTSREVHSRLTGAVPDKWGVSEYLPISVKVQRGIFTTADLPALRDYLREAERLTVPATEERIMIHVGKLALHYPQPALNEEMNASRWDDWFDDFADVPEDVLEAACRDWRRGNNKFAPAPGQLLALCVSHKSRQLIARRARECIELLEAQ